MEIGKTAALLVALIFLLPVAAPAQHGPMKGMDMPKSAPEKTPIKAVLKPAEGASIKVVAPKQDQVLKGDSVPLEFKLIKGKRGHHAHAYVDGQLMGMFESAKGTLNGIKPGKHTLELRVVADDHKTELDATDKVTFTTK